MTFLSCRFTSSMPKESLARKTDISSGACPALTVDIALVVNAVAVLD